MAFQLLEAHNWANIRDKVAMWMNSAMQCQVHRCWRANASSRLNTRQSWRRRLAQGHDRPRFPWISTVMPSPFPMTCYERPMRESSIARVAMKERPLSARSPKKGQYRIFDKAVLGQYPKR
ncbi:MAG: hypothetical protein R3F44_01410 [Candidatus Competibacteraceae bacterium]